MMRLTPASACRSTAASSTSQEIGWGRASARLSRPSAPNQPRLFKRLFRRRPAASTSEPRSCRGRSSYDPRPCAATENGTPRRGPRLRLRLPGRGVGVEHRRDRRVDVMESDPPGGTSSALIWPTRFVAAGAGRRGERPRADHRRAGDRHALAHPASFPSGRPHVADRVALRAAPCRVVVRPPHVT